MKPATTPPEAASSAAERMPTVEEAPAAEQAPAAEPVGEPLQVLPPETVRPERVEEVETDVAALQYEARLDLQVHAFVVQQRCCPEQ